MSGGGSNLDSTVATVETIVSTIAGAVMTINPGAGLLGFTVQEFAVIMNGVISGAPQWVAAWNNVKAAFAGGAAPSAADLAALRALVDAADDQLQADVAAKSQT